MAEPIREGAATPIRVQIRRSVIVLALTLAALGGGAVWAAAFSAEDHVLERLVEPIAEELASGVDPEAAASLVEIRPVSELSPALLAEIEGRPDGSYELEGMPIETRVALVTTPDGERLAVVAELDRDLTNWRLAALLLAGFLGALVLSTVVAHRSAHGAVEPVERLAEVLDSGERPPAGFSSAFAPNEVGILARAFEGTIERLDDAVARERDFLADASHELRTPLAVMRTTVDTLRKEGGMEEPRDLRRIERLDRAVGRMELAVTSLLWLAREEQGGQIGDPPDLMQGIHDMVATARADLAGGVELILDVVHEPRLPGRSGPWLVALSNLLANAIQHTREGSIHLRLGLDEVEVIDTGVGMDPETLAHAGTRWCSGRADGTGLGLSIVRRVAGRHDWELRLDSEVGRGTSASLRPKATAGDVDS